MIRFSLNGDWTLSFQGKHIPARVPGSLYHDLLQNNMMEDPFWRDNEDKVPIIDTAVYERSFIITEELLKHESILLQCEGLDTLADIRINGAQTGTADNMHRTWEFPLMNLQPGENKISVTFHSPVEYIRKRQAEVPTDGSPESMAGYPHIRKAHHMFGWDWGPRLPDIGIWRDISILATNSARLKSVRISQTHHNGAVTLDFFPELCCTSGNAADYDLDYKVTAPDGSEYHGSQIQINKPELWQPNGFGCQPLYTIEAALNKAGYRLDLWKRRFGLRTITISQEKDQFGEEFCFLVNGIKIFAMGGDYIPEDSIIARMSPQRTRDLLTHCAQINMNTIRIWGGAFYPADYFYDICDELGLIVWQDFMFACAVYELSPEFEENIRAELQDNIRRVRHHACLGLWCGNNEMEWEMENHTRQYSPRQLSAYFRMYEHIFPEILQKLDPDTFYWPASPSSGGGFDEPNAPDRGNVHHWDVWHGGKPFSDYRNHLFRFVSEFGFQSFPCYRTIETFTQPEDRNIFSYVMEKHQRNHAANGKIMNYLGQTYLYPHSFETLLYASQLLQAEAIRYGVEHWRRNRGCCMGAIYWQINDCWPVASWSSIDYYGRWKALHYYAKRFFAPVLLSACEEGVITQNTNVNGEHFVINKSVRFSISNETKETFTGKVNWYLRTPDSAIIQKGSQQVKVAALSAQWLEETAFPEAPLFESYVSYELLGSDDRLISRGSVLFCLPKQFHFTDPKLTAHIHNDYITVKANSYAQSIEISSPECDLLLSDNYFDMNKGEHTVKIIKGAPKTINLRSVYNIR